MAVFLIPCTNKANKLDVLYNICKEEVIMSKVELNTSAPDFTLADYQGNQIRLSDFKDQSIVLLVFNRTFT